MPPILLLALLLAAAAFPARAAEPAAADIDRLLEVMQVERMTREALQEMAQAQKQMLATSFGDDIPEHRRDDVEAAATRYHRILADRLSWATLKPAMGKVYAQVYTQQEVEAMIAFYGNPLGAEIQRKSSRVSALMMQEMLPAMQGLMADMKAETGAAPAQP